MDKTDRVDDATYIFGSLLVAANRIDTLLERELRDFDVTSKQWFLSLIVDNLFFEPPSLKEVAREMGSSHQNVKQVALKLEQKGLIELFKDPRDARVTRLRQTAKSAVFWESVSPRGEEFMRRLFAGLSPEDLGAARRVLKGLIANLTGMENDKEEQKG